MSWPNFFFFPTRLIASWSYSSVLTSRVAVHHVDMVFWIWAQAETCSTIIACSIPALRVLVRDFQARRRRDHSSSYPTPGGYLRSDTWSKLRRTGPTLAREVDADASNSTEQILSTGQQRYQGRILRTTEVTLHVSNELGAQQRGYAKEEGFELQDRSR